MTLLMQLKFLLVKMNASTRKNLITLLFIFFSIFSINRCYAIAVGEPYHGGTVFCVSKTEDITQCVPVGSGDFGLIMANEDQANFDSNPKHGVTWSSAYSDIPGARSLDNGASNTAAIIAAFPKDDPSNNAAWLCHNYKDQKGTWYLPSKNELNKMYAYAKASNLIGKGCSGSKPGGVQCLVGGYSSGDMLYWSSSEYSFKYAWYQGFSNGLQANYNPKMLNFFGVRAVRAFNDSTIKQFNNSLSNLNQCQIIQEIAENNPDMISVDLSSRGIAAGHTLQLAEALRTNNHIEHIDLRGNGLTDDTFTVFINAILGHPSLRTVDITGVNSLSPGVIDKLSKFK